MTMDNHIIDASIPSGSVILAYGSPSPRSRIPKILAIIAGIFGIILGLFVVAALTINKVPLPNDAVALAYVPGKTLLSNDAPQLWRDTQDRSGQWPIFVGYTITRDGAFAPFALTPKTTDITSTANTFAWKLVSDTSLANTPKSFFGLPGHMTSYFHGMWLKLSWDGSTMGGALDAQGWKTDAKIATSQQTLRSFSGDGYVNLRAFPESAAILSPSLEGVGLELTDTVEADAIRWAHGASSTAVSLDFAGGISSSTAVRLAEATGLHDTVIVTLPDGSTRSDLRPPVALLAGSTSTVWEVDGKELAFSPQSATLSSGLVGWNETHVPDRCPGNLVAAFDPESQNRIRQGLAIFFPDIHSTIFWIEKDGKLQACW